MSPSVLIHVNTMAKEKETRPRRLSLRRAAQAIFSLVVGGNTLLGGTTNPVAAPAARASIDARVAAIRASVAKLNSASKLHAISLPGDGDAGIPEELAQWGNWNNWANWNNFRNWANWNNWNNWRNY
jgi:hypothetical protein